jgi:hypothetical protein
MIRGLKVKGYSGLGKSLFLILQVTLSQSIESSCGPEGLEEQVHLPEEHRVTWPETDRPRLTLDGIQEGYRLIGMLLMVFPDTHLIVEKPVRLSLDNLKNRGGLLVED